MILLAQRPGAAVFLVGVDEACGGGAGKRIDLDTCAVALVDLVRANAHGEWVPPVVTVEQIAALERLSKYGPVITVEAAGAMVTASGRRYLYPGPACIDEDGNLSDAGLYVDDAFSFPTGPLPR